MVPVMTVQKTRKNTVRGKRVDRVPTCLAGCLGMILGLEDGGRG